MNPTNRPTDSPADRPTGIASPLFEQFDQWLHEQILQLSVDRLGSGVLTCTACEEVFGEYIIEYSGEKFRLPAGQTYAFLQFVAAATSVPETPASQPSSS